MPTAEHAGRAMGCDVHLVVVGDRAEAAVVAGARLLVELESRWSRFRDDSEVAALNRASGRAVGVSSATALLVERAVAGWTLTAGLFDPTVLPGVVAAGYDRDLATLPRDPAVRDAVPAPGCRGIEVDRTAGTVRLPDGVAFDPGGIGKGLAADLVVAALLRRPGIDGACANIGGDVRCAGVPPRRPSAWTVALDDGDAGGRREVIDLVDGAVATSSTRRRRWSRGRHHVIDPATGAPASHAADSATVAAPTAWLAEVLATAVLLAPPRDADDLLRRHGAGGRRRVGSQTTCVGLWGDRPPPPRSEACVRHAGRSLQTSAAGAEGGRG